MKYFSFFLATAVIACGVFLAPSATYAKVATLDNLTCETAHTDITPSDEFDPEQRSEENYQVFWYYITIGEDCVMDISYDEAPLMVFVSGGTMTETSNWTVDEEAKTAQINFTSREIQQIDSQVENSFGEGETLTTVAFIWEAEAGDGPGDETKGGWVATDFQEYSLVTNETRLGAQVQGDEGLFAMYMPATTVSAFAESHDDYDPATFDTEEDMAVYLGNEEQVDESVDETADGGAFLSFSAIIDTDNEVGSDDGEGEGGSEDGEEGCDEGDPSCECPAE